MRGMRKNAKHALIFAAAIVGGMAAPMRSDASEWVDNSSQTNPRGAAYTVKTYTEGSDHFDACSKTTKTKAQPIWQRKEGFARRNPVSAR